MRHSLTEGERDHSREMKRTADPEHRPLRRGEKSEARRLADGFRILAGEGVYDDEAETEDD